MSLNPLNIRSLDVKLLNDLFEMNSGYVLDFSDRTMALFFAEELNIDIDDICYKKDGTSKAKRLRCFLNVVDKATVVRTLTALWDYREAIRQQQGRDEWVTNGHGRFLELINKLQGTDKPATPSFATHQPPVVAFDRHRLASLHQELLALTSFEAHARGYAFEKFLKNLFDAHGLSARDAFRLQGEQIDGSFVLNSDTYLLEAKWHNAPIGAADLHVFHGKIDQKAAWTRGLFVSHSSFTPEGLNAFGRGKRIICMDGLDLSDMLTRELPLNHVLERKVRRAGETGLPFVQVRELFP